MHRLAQAFLLSSFILAPVVAQAQNHSGHRGHGHDALHAEFYSKLIRKDTKTSCCNMTDCRPTQTRMMSDHYQVLVEDEWVRVPETAIQSVKSPDGGAHVCAPEQRGRNKGVIYCVVLPPET